MDHMDLQALSEEHLGHAREASSGRSAHTLYGGREHHLRQTLIALRGGAGLAEHSSPGDATLQVLSGRVRLVAGPDSADLGAGSLVAIPPMAHSLDSLDDAVVLLTVSTR